jgi:hypothetical protein
MTVGVPTHFCVQRFLLGAQYPFTSFPPFFCFFISNLHYHFTCLIPSLNGLGGVRESGVVSSGWGCQNGSANLHSRFLLAIGILNVRGIVFSSFSVVSTRSSAQPNPVFSFPHFFSEPHVPLCYVRIPSHAGSSLNGLGWNGFVGDVVVCIGMLEWRPGNASISFTLFTARVYSLIHTESCFSAPRNSPTVQQDNQRKKENGPSP